jgi:hypothetical protein
MITASEHGPKHNPNGGNWRRFAAMWAQGDVQIT